MNEEQTQAGSDNQSQENPEEKPAGEAGAGQQPGASASASGTPEERVAALEVEKNDIRERMLRIAAEFENFKKRVRREQSEAEVKSRETVLRDILEVIDNLERAVSFSEASDPKALQQGVQLVLRLFQSKLERYDVKAFESKGQPFDPRVHDAISQVPTADAPPGAVVNEVQKGYRIGERLLRPAMVAVAVAPPSGGGGGTPTPGTPAA
jgi:molecular chaperone GrpE